MSNNTRGSCCNTCNTSLCFRGSYCAPGQKLWNTKVILKDNVLFTLQDLWIKSVLWEYSCQLNIYLLCTLSRLSLSESMQINVFVSCQNNFFMSPSFTLKQSHLSVWSYWSLPPASPHFLKFLQRWPSRGVLGTIFFLVSAYELLKCSGACFVFLLLDPPPPNTHNSELEWECHP